MRCQKPVNRLLMLRTRGLAGPFFQKVAENRCVRTAGNKWAPRDAPALGHNYNYSTPASHQASTPGALQHPDTPGNFFYVNQVDADGEDISDLIQQLRIGDVLHVGANDFTITSDLVYSSPEYLFTVSPGTQIADGTYNITVTRP